MSLFTLMHRPVVAAPAPAYTYATWNAEDMWDEAFALSGGGLTTSFSGGGWTSGRATIGLTTGKHYFELTGASGAYTAIGLGTLNAPLGSIFSTSTQGWSLQSHGYNGNNGIDEANGVTWGASDVERVLINLDDDTAYYYVGATLVKTWDLSARGSDAIYPMIAHYANGNGATVNFGQNPFAYAVPEGYRAGVYVG